MESALCLSPVSFEHILTLFHSIVLLSEQETAFIQIKSWHGHSSVNQRGRSTSKIWKEDLLLSTRKFSGLSRPGFLWNKLSPEALQCIFVCTHMTLRSPPFLPVLSAEALILCGVRYPWPGWLSSSGFVFVMRGQDCVVFDLRCFSLTACYLV